MNVLFLIPSKLDGPSARYIMDLSDSLSDVNVRAFISSENDDETIKRKKGNKIINIRMPIIGDIESFDIYLANIEKLNIDIVFSVGSRIKIDIIGLYLKKRGVTYIKQFEDDEKTIFLNCNKNSKSEEYCSLLEAGSIINFNDVDMNSLHETKFKVIDPFIKGLTLSLLDGYAKIWGGLSFDEEKYLDHLSFLSLPPVCSKEEIEVLNQKVNHKKLNDSSPTYFIGGSIYSQKDADTFISAWKEFKVYATDASLIISYSRTSKVVISNLIATYDGSYDIKIIDLPSDEEYLNVLSSAPYVLSIGGGEFDEKRLPSRLVKSMFLGKTILVPSVGFGRALTHKKNAFICRSNSKSDWLDTLKESYKERINNSVSQNASRFAKTNFDINHVSNEFKIFSLGILRKKHSIMNVNSSPFINAPLDNCMLADLISLNNTDDKGQSRSAVKRVRYRFIHSGDSLFVQTLDRADYNFQVECSAQALASDSTGISDSGFKFLKRHGFCELFNMSLNPTVSGEEYVWLLNSFRGKFSHLSANARSSMFDKCILSFRLYKLLNEIVRELGVKFVFFHADMQSVEALVSAFINTLNPKLKTITLQHALFYDTIDSSDVNIVNTRVSPSTYSFLWDEYVAEVLCKHNPNKKVEFTAPIPSLLFKNLTSESKKRNLLVILDGPNHQSFNENLLMLCDRLVKNKIISEYDIKPHPYHTSKQLDKITANVGRKLVQSINYNYKDVVFISSTLGMELYNSEFSTCQFMPKKFSSVKLTVKHSNIKTFSSYEFLSNRIKQSCEMNDEIKNHCFETNVLNYQESFKNVLGRLK
jgi:hypothetical protein